MASEPAAPAPRRHFLALLPDERARAGLAACAVPPGARKALAPDLHLTLAFLGTLDASQEAAVLAVVGARQRPPAEVWVDRLEFWPGSRAWVATVTEERATLRTLAAELDVTLAPVLARHPRPTPFRTHVTLARGVPGRPEPSAMHAPIQWAATQIVLMASGLASAPKYAPRGAVALSA